MLYLKINQPPTEIQMQTDNMNQSTFPNDKVRIVDVTARDGLQNEKENCLNGNKIKSSLINSLRLDTPILKSQAWLNRPGFHSWPMLKMF